MALETGTYISDLVSTNPAGSDALAFADDHLRLIKSTLKNTFPNLSGAVTLNQYQLNAAMPIGGIIMWSGASVPSGWALCDGRTVARSDGAGNITTPVLVDRFIVGAGGTNYGIGATGGSNTVNLSTSQMPSHSHGVTDPTHAHGVNDPTHSHGVNDPGHWHDVAYNGGGTGINGFAGPIAPGPHTQTSTSHTGITTIAQSTGITTINQATGISIQNSGSGAPVDVRPPYVALYYIMKI
jgi:microcystin-dependent protein